MSLSLLLLAVVLTYTGIVLYIAPHGRIAYWTDWHILGLDKGQLGAIHAISSFAFVLLGWLHTWLNGKALLAYLKDRARRLRVLTPEVGVAIALVGAIVVGTGLSLPPFVQLVDAGEAAKSWWEQSEGSPPYGHAELSSLNKICRRLGLEPQLALQALQDRGWEVGSIQDTLLEIGQANDASPAAVYRQLEDVAATP